MQPYGCSCNFNARLQKYCFRVVNRCFSRVRIQSPHNCVVSVLPGWGHVAAVGRLLLSQQMVIEADILILSVFQPEPAGDGAQRYKAQPLIQMPGMDIVRNHRIELQ